MKAKTFIDVSVSFDQTKAKKTFTFAWCAWTLTDTASDIEAVFVGCADTICIRVHQYKNVFTLPVEKTETREKIAPVKKRREW